MESKWRANKWLLGLSGEDTYALYARLLDFEFPFYLRGTNNPAGLYEIGHVTVNPGEVSDFPLFFIVDSTHLIPAPPYDHFPYGLHVEPDHV